DGPMARDPQVEREEGERLRVLEHHGGQAVHRFGAGDLETRGGEVGAGAVNVQRAVAPEVEDQVPALRVRVHAYVRDPADRVIPSPNATDRAQLFGDARVGGAAGDAWNEGGERDDDEVNGTLSHDTAPARGTRHRHQSTSQ